MTVTRDDIVNTMLDGIQQLQNEYVEEHSLSSNNSNVRQYSSNDDNMFNAFDDEDDIPELKWINTLKLNDKIDARLFRYGYESSSPWIIVNIQKIRHYRDFCGQNVRQYYVVPEKEIGRLVFREFEPQWLDSLQDASKMAKLNTHTPMHLYLMDHDTKSGKGKVNEVCSSQKWGQKCDFCSKMCCKHCFLDEYYRTGKYICYICMFNKYQESRINLIACSIFNPFCDYMDVHLMTLICLYSMGITIKCCNNNINCCNEINFSIYEYYQRLQSPSFGIGKSLRLESPSFPYRSIPDINGKYFYHYKPHKAYSIGSYANLIEKRIVFCFDEAIRAFCGKCYKTKLKKCIGSKYCSNYDSDEICKSHPMCGYIRCKKVIIYPHYATKCKICDAYYHSNRCGMNKVCQNCTQLPWIIHYKSKDALLTKLNMNDRNPRDYYYYKDRKSIDGLYELLCKECTYNGSNNSICPNHQQVYLGAIAICCCCDKLIMQDVRNDGIVNKCSECTWCYHIDCSSVVDATKCINCITRSIKFS